MDNSSAISVLLADDHALLRKGLRTVLQKLKKDNIQVIGEAANGQEALASAAERLPDIVLMDIEMPMLDGIKTTLALKQQYPEVKVIGLSGYNEAGIVIDMLSAGAEGYLLKDTTTEELRQAIIAVYEGGTYYTPATHRHLKEKLEQERYKLSVLPSRPLTAREIEVLQLICEGKASKEIGALLHLSKRTIDSYREKIMSKTGARNGIEMLHYAVKSRLYQPPK